MISKDLSISMSHTIPLMSWDLSIFMTYTIPMISRDLSQKRFFFFFKYWFESNNFNEIIWILIMKLEKSDLKSINMSKPLSKINGISYFILIFYFRLSSSFAIISRGRQPTYQIFDLIPRPIQLPEGNLYSLLHPPLSIHLRSDSNIRQP